MARTAAVKPLVSRGYGKILFATLVAMLIACGLMGYEIFVEYDGKTQADRKSPAKVPSSLPPAEKGGAVVPPPGPGPVVPPEMP